MKRRSAEKAWGFPTESLGTRTTGCSFWRLASRTMLGITWLGTNRIKILALTAPTGLKQANNSRPQPSQRNPSILCCNLTQTSSQFVPCLWTRNWTVWISMRAMDTPTVTVLPPTADPANCYISDDFYYACSVHSFHEQYVTFVCIIIINIDEQWGRWQ